MTHVRTTIRRQFADLFAGNDYTVLGTRTSKRNRDGAALIDLRFASVAVSQQTMGNDRLHTGTFLVRVQREGEEEDIVDLLDDDEIRLTKLINDFNWSDLLEDDPELQMIDYSFDAESEVTIGVLSLRFEVTYRIDKTKPEIVRK